jgi:hypothetical protein
LADEHRDLRLAVCRGSGAAGVERFFGLITHDRIRRGVFTSVPELEAASTTTSTITMPTPNPSSGQKSAEEILAKVSRARRTLETVAQGIR